MKICILGCGPAGLLAAHAAFEQGHDVNIMSKKEPSFIQGAQYIHVPIPNITYDRDAEDVYFAKVGKERGYAEKVYLDREAPTSWNLFGGSAKAWPMEDIYTRLWTRYESFITAVKLFPSDIKRRCEDYDLVLSTVPATALCGQRNHEFRKASVWTAQHELIQVRNLIVYNGRSEDKWYRASNLFGHCQVEFGQRADARYEGASSERVPRVWMDDQKVLVHGARKPIGTDCDCHLHHDNFKRLGRFGQWKKGILVSDAYAGAKLAIKDREADIEML